MKKTWLLFFLTVVAFSSKAQWECPSKLAAYLAPVGNSKLLVGGEVGSTTGFLDGNSINSALGFVGADYSFRKHSFYLEGGLKSWAKYDFDSETLFHNERLGLRELFYQYRGNVNSFTLGLQTSSFDDNYLLNERIAGLNYKVESGRWKFNAYAGSVTKDFARNGIYCTNGFLYSLSTGQNLATLGNALGDKDLAGFTLSYSPQKEKRKKTTPQKADDEFESFDNNEFDSFDSGLIQEDKKGFPVALEKIGLAAYSEFGNWISEPFFLTGGFAEIKLPAEIYIKPEILYQSATDNAAIIYLIKLDKSFTFNNGHRATINAGWYNFSEVDEGATLLNSYSNIFAGEVLRLDAVNMPLYLLGLKYNIPAAKIHVKIQNAAQFNGNDLNEWDLEIGKKFGNKLNMDTKFGTIQGGELSGNVLLARLEMRYYF